MGGDAKKQIDSVKEYDLFEILKSKEGIILGVSAGYIFMSRHSYFAILDSIIFSDKVYIIIFYSYK